MTTEKDRVENAMLEAYKAWGFECGDTWVTVSPANVHHAKEHLKSKGLGHIKVSARTNARTD
jgi:hypothetical protein